MSVSEYSHNLFMPGILIISCNNLSFSSADAFVIFQFSNSNLIHLINDPYLYSGWLNFIRPCVYLRSGEVNISKEGIFTHLPDIHFLSHPIFTLRFTSSHSICKNSIGKLFNLFLYISIVSICFFRSNIGSSKSKKHALMISSRYSFKDKPTSSAMACVP